MVADLFHVTVRSSVEDVFADGLRGDVAIRAEQKLPEGERTTDAMVPEPAERQADRRAEELIQAARSEADVPREWPRHTDGVFFWPTQARAVRVAQGDYIADPIVAVDSSKLPDGCRCVIAPTDTVDYAFRRAYEAATDRDHLGPDEERELVDDLVDWWKEVEEYTGQAHRDHEVWCGCSVPPVAIEWIHDPEEDRRLYEPPDDPAQQRFIDLF